MMSPRLLESNDETLFFEVTSFTDNSIKYDVMYDVDHRWLCTCPDYYFRKRFCKHMRECAEMMGIHDVSVYAEVS
ncbi:MAG: hypothetical protein J6M91_04620 [Methanobrevibacter sp.]|nr:hypothetical protein [Methanobrevibacter sp.]